MVKIKPKEFRKGPIDQSDCLIKEFWERIAPSNCLNITNDENMMRIVELCKAAQEVVIIYTPKLTLPELNCTFEQLLNNKVRIYAITTNVKNHKELFKCGIMREKRDLHSTFILIDPKFNPKGFWCTQELTSNSRYQSIITLNKKQIYELWQHFSCEFWNAEGEELFYGKIRNTPKYDGEKITVHNILEVTSRQLELLLVGTSVDTMYLPQNKPPNFQEHMLTKKLYIPVSEETRQLILEIDKSNSTLFGVPLCLVGYVEGRKKSGDKISILFNWDYSMILDERQLEEVKKILPEAAWQYHPEKRISDITNEIILNSDNWDMPKPNKIKDEGVVRLKDIECASIQEWIEESPVPIIPTCKEILYRKVTYEWILHPPYLPPGSNEHALNESWKKFEVELRKYIDKIISKMMEVKENIDPNLKGTKKILYGKNIDEFVSELNRIKEEDWKYRPNTLDIKEAIERIVKIEEEFQKMIEQDENKKVEPNEIEEVINLKLNGKKPIPPYRTLPQKGKLYEKHSIIYIVIEDSEDIKYVDEYARKYKCTIVVKRDKNE